MKKIFKTKPDYLLIGKVLLAVVVAVSIIFIAASSFSNVTFSNITGTIESFFLNLKKGEGYPYECSTDGPEKALPIGSCFALIDDSHVVFLNKTAKEILSFDTTYTNPDMSVSNGRSVIYNRGTSAFVVTGQSDVLYDSNDTKDKIKNGIITADIGRNGSIAFATWSDDGVSKFTMLNKKLSPEFYYVFGSERILCVTLSDNGRYGACAVFGTENADYYSTVYVFDFNKEEPIKKVKYVGETVINLDFLSNKKLNVITDLKRRVVNVKDKNDENVVDYSAHTLVSVDFDSSSKRGAVCYSKYGSTLNVVHGFYKNGKESCLIDNLKNVKNITCNSSLIAVLCEDKVFFYNYSGNLKGQVDLTFNIDSVKMDSSYLYLFSGSNIYRVKAGVDSVLEVE